MGAPKASPVSGELQALVECLRALGFRVDWTGLARAVGMGPAGSRKAADALQRAAREGGDGKLPARVRKGITRRLLALSRAVEGVPASSGPACGARPDDLAGQLARASGKEREAIRDSFLAAGNGCLVRPRHMSPKEFQRFFQATFSGRDLSLGKLATFVSQELARRGRPLSMPNVRRLFGSGECGTPIPRCIKHVLIGINGEFDTGLMPVLELTGGKPLRAWLEGAREKLLFRSHSSMHKAIAESTGLKYDSVHKALSGSKTPLKIRVEIKTCVDGWLRLLQSGGDPDVRPIHRGVPVAEIEVLLPALEAGYGTKEAVYRRIAKQTGRSTSCIRRYFRPVGLLKHASLAAYRCALEMLQAADSKPAIQSYLGDETTRRAARRLEREAALALQQWRDTGHDVELELRFRELRRALIATMKQQRPVAPCPM